MATKAQHGRGYRALPGLLRSLREEAELTQRELGARLRRPQSWIYNCETGNRRVDLAEFCDWCQGCGVDPSAALRRFLAASR
jgi:transcriptional regulator with XRE-family HTH domain